MAVGAGGHTLQPSSCEPGGASSTRALVRLQVAGKAEGRRRRREVGGRSTQRRGHQLKGARALRGNAMVIGGRLG